MLPWLDREDVCVVRFEALVGPRGGGTKEEQISELGRMAAFLRPDLDRDGLAEAADGLFDPSSPTFRSGQAGDWRQHFLPEDVEAFKDVAGDLLIRLGYESGLDW
jgi:hypothetical protein